MLSKRVVEQLGDWTGYRVERVEPSETRVTIYLQPRRRRMQCSRCGRIGTRHHETVVRRIRDLPLFDRPVVLVVPVRRIWCEHCRGPQTEQVTWLGRRSRVTQRLARAIGQLCQVLSIRHVAAHYRLDWHTVKNIDKAQLASQLSAPHWDVVRVLAIDEFALHRGHRYATVVADVHSGQVLWVGQGRSKQTMETFFAQLPEGVAENIEAVVMDMNGAYAEAFTRRCPQAKLVFDLFHVVAKYGREVIDRVRVDEANRLRDDRPARRVVKSARWLLLRNRQTLEEHFPERLIDLDELLAANQALMTVYILKEDLKQLWQFRQEEAARHHWQDWLRRAMDSGLEPLIRFARRLQPYLRGILAHCRYPYHTSFLEGINNKIKLIKRTAYGFRDQDYFFLKIRAAFPGNAR